MNEKNIKKLREQIRMARKQIPAHYAQLASYKFSERIAQLPAYQNANSIAGFLAFDGEADPAPLMDRAILEKKSVFVPVIIGKAKPLLFAAWTRDTPLKKNSFGILEPDVTRDTLIEANQIECVITPLVAFDENGNRIGVGGGYYDRSFAFLNERATANSNTTTTLIGLAFEVQKVKKITRQTWDVRLDAVVTELAVYTA